MARENGSWMSFARELLLAVVGAATVLVGIPTIFDASAAAGYSRIPYRDVAQPDRKSTSAADESERETESDEEGSASDHLWLVHASNAHSGTSLDRTGVAGTDHGRPSARPRLDTHAIRGPPARG